MESFAQWLVEIVGSFGYPGLFILSFLGNVLVPIPVEVVMIPAGFLIEQGQMKLWAVLLSAIGGDICGSVCGYYLALHFGRRFLYAYGKYLFFTHERMQMLDKFFASHGEISTLTGRLVPGLRHFMAFPAGLSHMNVKKFALYTGVGGGLWISTLLLIGYVIGGNEALIKHYLPLITWAVVLGVGVMIVLYIWRHRRKLKGSENGMA